MTNDYIFLSHNILIISGVVESALLEHLRELGEDKYQ